MNTHPLDKYTAAALDVIDLAVRHWNDTWRDSDNPRWLIASPRSYSTGTAQIQSSQLLRNPGAKVWPIALDDSAWNAQDVGGQWFRALKHAYLDALNIRGGMPRDSVYRDTWNRVMGISEHAHELIAARITPTPEPEPPTGTDTPTVDHSPVADLNDAGKYHEAADLALSLAGATLTIKPGSGKDPRWTTTPGRNKHYRCTITGPGGRHSFDFWQSVAGTDAGEVPTAYDVLTCLQWHPVEDNAADFAQSYGYTNGKEAAATWRACKAQAEALARIFTPEQLDTLAQVQ